MSVIQFPSMPDYIGKTVAVSPENPTSRFQCRGFVVFRNNPQVVPPDADMSALQTALLDGRLVEMSPGSAIKSKNASLNPASEIGDTDKKIFTLMTNQGPIVLTPDTSEQAEAIEKELQETGQLDLSHFPEIQKQKSVVPHFTGITITELDDQPDAESNSN
jgi:hypothetical protein